MRKKSELKKKGALVIHNFSGYFLIFCLVLSGLFLLDIFTPFLVILLLAAILATAFYPLYEKILKFFGNRERVASFIACLVVLFVIIIPLTIFFFLLGKQAYDVFVFMR